MTGATVGTTDTVGECRGRLFALLMGGAALAFVAEAALYIVFTDSWVDELVFVAGGHGFVTGKFVLYAGDFQTNYPPVGFLVIGLVQALAGPSFYAGRVVSALVAVAGLALMAYTAARLGGRWAAVLAVWLTVSTGFVLGHLVTATPYSLVLLFVMAAVAAQVSTLPAIWKDILSGAFMSLAMMTRQDMAVLFVVLLLYLVWVHRRRGAALVAGLSGLVVAGLVVAPFLPEVLRVFAATPGWNLLGNELLVQPPSWTKASRLQALLDYIRTYRWLLFLLVAAAPTSVLVARRQAGAAGAGGSADRRPNLLLWGLFVASFLLHIWPPAFCPYCVLNYGVYYWPLGAILIGVTVATVVAHSDGLARNFVIGVMVAVIGFSMAGSFRVLPVSGWSQAPLQVMHRTAERIRTVTTETDKAFMLGDHHALFLSGRAFFPPLINWYYTFRRDGPEAALRRYGLWDLKALDGWLLREATVVVLPRDGVSYPEDIPEGREMLGLIARRVREGFRRQAVLDDAWQAPLVVYRKVM